MIDPALRCESARAMVEQMRTRTGMSPDQLKAATDTVMTMVRSVVKDEIAPLVKVEVMHQARQQPRIFILDGGEKEEVGQAVQALVDDAKCHAEQLIASAPALPRSGVEFRDRYVSGEQWLSDLVMEVLQDWIEENPPELTVSLPDGCKVPLKRAFSEAFKEHDGALNHLSAKITLLHETHHQESFRNNQMTGRMVGWINDLNTKAGALQTKMEQMESRLIEFEEAMKVKGQRALFKPI